MVDKQPLVSIIVPVRDGELFLGDALDSAVRQTYANIEVIVVDDGSRDRSFEIANNWATRDSRIRVIRQTNQGVALARNRGLADARGELVAPLDADDLWDPTKIERQVRRLAEAGDDVGLVYCWWTTIDGEGAVLDCSPSWRVEGHAATPLVLVNYTGNASVPLFRRRLLEQVGGYDPRLRERNAQGCEDFDVALKVAERSRVAVVPAWLVAYRRIPGTMSTETGQMERSHRLVIGGAASRRSDLSPAVVRQSNDQLALHLAAVSWWAGKYASAVLWGLRALRSATAIQVLPHAARLIARRLLKPDESNGRVIRPGAQFSDWPLPASLIPYDRIYRRRFARLRDRR